MNDINIKMLQLSDLKEYKRIRLELLKNEDESFGSSYDEEASFDNQMWVNRLSKSTILAYGAFSNETLVGISLGVLNPRKKMKHSAAINSVYVTPNFRGKGIARKLMETVITVLETKNIEIIKLSVVTTNTNAVKMYKSLGFTIYGTEEGSIKVNNTYIDQYLMIRKAK